MMATGTLGEDDWGDLFSERDRPGILAASSREGTVRRKSVLCIEMALQVHRGM
jgi:hypothetical protein